MKMKYIHITNLAYFLTDTLNWHVLWDKEKYLLNSLYKWKIKKLGFFKTNVNSKESLSSKDK